MAKMTSSFLQQVARRSEVGLPGSLPGALALPKFPSAGLRCDVTQQRREALHPCRLYEDLAEDGGIGRPGVGSSHRDLQYDDPQTRASCCATLESSLP